MEISQVSIKNSSYETKEKLVNDIMRLLNVRDKNKEMSKDWLLFISTSNFKIAPGEIYLAFQMALSREIFDDKGKEIDLFPELSNNTTGKVISSYLKFKKESEVYQRAKDKLKALKTPENDFSEKDKNNIRIEFIKTIYEDLKENGFSENAWHLYDDLELNGKIKISDFDKRVLYKQELAKYIPVEKENIKKRSGLSTKTILAEFQKKIDSGNTLVYVKNKCKSIIVSNYLNKNLDSFEKFKDIWQN